MLSPGEALTEEREEYAVWIGLGRLSLGRLSLLFFHCYLLFSFMLTEKMKDVVKTTQIITQINTIQWHNSYKTTNKLHLDINGSGYRRVHMAVSVTGATYIAISHYRYDITACQDSGGVVGSWTGTYYSHLMGIIHLLFQHNSQCFEEPIIPKIMPNLPRPNGGTSCPVTPPHAQVLLKSVCDQWYSEIDY